MELNLKSLGYIFIIFSLVLFLLFTLLKIDNDNTSLILCEKFHETHNGMENCPVHKSFFSWLITISYTISLVILVSGIYLVFSNKNIKVRTEKEFVNINQSKLTDEEKSIYDLIKSKGGSLYQSDIIKEIGISKVKTTRILDKLESMNILERKRRGMTNIIVLK